MGAHLTGYWHSHGGLLQSMHLVGLSTKARFVAESRGVHAGSAYYAIFILVAMQTEQGAVAFQPQEVSLDLRRRLASCRRV